MSVPCSAPKLIDLFCGCGGMSLGAARAGFHVLAAIDHDKRALAAHARNFPKTVHLDLDLHLATGAQLLGAIGCSGAEVDVIAGGPPCQGFSHMGRRDTADTRNLLLYDFFRLVGEIMPRAFVLENVPGLLQGQYAAWLNRAAEEVEGSYWFAGPRQITAYDAGAPTMRKRVFLIGFRRDVTSSFAADMWATCPELRAPSVRHALDGLPKDISSDWRRSRSGVRKVKVTRSGFFFASATSRIPDNVGDPPSMLKYLQDNLVSGCIGTEHSAELTERYAALAYGKADSKTKSVRLNPDGYCPTLRAGTGRDKGSFQAVRPIHHSRPRVITPREAARLQGFPDWYQFDTTKWHSFRQIGNSVSPLVSEYILRRVRTALDGEGS